MIESPLAVSTVLALVTALAFWLDRNVPALSKVGASLLVIVFGALLSNFGVVAVESPVYDAVTGPVTSLAVAWLLLAVHLRDLKRAGPRMLAAYGLAAAGTLAGSFLGAVVFASVFGPDTWKLAGSFMGTYSGGSLNFVAVGREVGLPDTLFAGAAAADNLTTGIWLAACLVLPVWLRAFYPDPPISSDRGAVEGREGPSDASEDHHPFFSAVPVSVLGLSLLLGAGLLLLAAARGLAALVPGVPEILWLTTLALAAGHLTPVSRIEGALQLGNYALHLFFAVIGIYSVLGEILVVGVSVLIFTLVVVGVHGLVVYGGGRLMGLD
ncbi:MAG: DUF819 family protein, partial [Gemmatimonadota bacterium]